MSNNQNQGPLNKDRPGQSQDQQAPNRQQPGTPSQGGRDKDLDKDRQDQSKDKGRM